MNPVRLQARQALHTRMNHGCLCLEQGYEIFPRAIFSGPWPARLMTISQAVTALA